MEPVNTKYTLLCRTVHKPLWLPATVDMKRPDVLSVDQRISKV